MNTFKTQFLALEATVLQLKEKLHKLEGTTPASQDCHYSSFDQEAGELSLDCMDTFRFVYTIPPNQEPTYNPSHQQPNPRCYTYTLINPSEELINYHMTQAKIHNTAYNKFSHSTPLNPGYGLKIITETPPDKLEQSDIQFTIPNYASNPYSQYLLPKTKEIKETLGEKFFAYSKVPKTIHPSPYPNPYSEFVHTETIQFKQEYEILPHVTFFLTPFKQDESNLICKIIDITCKAVTFEISYLDPIADSSEDAVLHWQVRGVKKENHADLLS